MVPSASTHFIYQFCQDVRLSRCEKSELFCCQTWGEKLVDSVGGISYYCMSVNLAAIEYIVDVNTVQLLQCRTVNFISPEVRPHQPVA